LKKESQITELVPPMSVTNPAAYKAMLDRQISKNVKVKTALGNKSHKDHKKAKSLFQRFMAKFKKKKNDEGFGGDLKGNDKKKFEKARKENAEVLGYKLTGKSDIKEAKKRDANNLAVEFGKSYQKFTVAVNGLAKSMTNITGDKTDGKIIMKAFKKHIIPFVQLVDSWNSGQQKNPHIDESVNEANIKDIAKVLKTKSAKKIDGMYMDMTTANAIMTVYKALNTTNKKKFAKLPLKKMVTVTWKLVK